MSQEVVTVAPTLAEQQKGVVKIPYKGQEIELTFDSIRRYLVTGKPELVTNQELMFFMGICKTRMLNPFNRDCYLIKFSANEGAAIVVAIDFMRSRARRQPDCRGWKAGIIVQHKDKRLEYREGHFILPEEERLVGGWFEAKPANWDEPKRHTVPLAGYIKKTKEGAITAFWKEEKQPMMISKVAEAQGLRMLWPEDLSNLYTDDEIIDGEVADGPGPMMIPSVVEEAATFDAMVAESIPQEEVGMFGRFLEAVQALSKTLTMDEIKAEAVRDWPTFYGQYQKWVARNKPAEEKQAPAPPPAEEKVEAPAPPPPPPPPAEEKKAAPPTKNPAPKEPDVPLPPEPPEPKGGGMMFPEMEESQAPPVSQADVKTQINELMDLAAQRKVPSQLIFTKVGVNNWMDFLDHPEKLQEVRAAIEAVPPPNKKK